MGVEVLLMSLHIEVEVAVCGARRVGGRFQGSLW